MPEQVDRREYRWRAFPEWHEKSLCGRLDPKKADEIFFGEGDNPTRATMTITQLKAVKSFCRDCPVFTECLTHSLVTPERHGIWAGTSKRTRLRILVLLDLREVTIPEVVQDYREGRERKYESIRHR
jgi:hypothetical protein